jgi:hypothetical protein
LGRVALVGDPVLDVTPSEPEVSTDPEPGWAFTAVAPPVDGGDGHSQVGGEFLDGEERLERFHLLIL